MTILIGLPGAALDAGLAEALRPLGTASFGHEISTGALPGLFPLRPGVKLVGTALPVRITCPDSTPIHAAVDLVRPGDVLVVDTGENTRQAGVGAIVAAMLALRSAAGVVVDGAVTDTAELRSGPLPVFCRAVSPLTTRVIGAPGSVNVPVTIGGQRVNPGDIVLGDDDGVLVLPVELARRLAPLVAAREAGEPGYLARFSEGVPLTEMTGADRVLAEHGRSVTEHETAHQEESHP
ncbi:RraA family protein [Nonomuraea sp. NPDC050153]|uniref:RraA family protein n=1 Tax=Nonomuraea sp. NPDC050153 TaxID=3364359 RepID=UPI0037A92D4F